MAITEHRRYGFFNDDNFSVHFVRTANFILKSSQLMQDSHNITLLLCCMVVYAIYVHMIMLMSTVTWLSITTICYSVWNRSRSCQQISFSLSGMSLWRIYQLQFTFTFSAFSVDGELVTWKNFFLSPYTKAITPYDGGQLILSPLLQITAQRLHSTASILSLYPSNLLKGRTLYSRFHTVSRIDLKAVQVQFQFSCNGLRSIIHPSAWVTTMSKLFYIESAHLFQDIFWTFMYKSLLSLPCMCMSVSKKRKRKGSFIVIIEIKDFF